MHHSRANSKNNKIDFTFFDDDCDSIKYQEHKHNDYSKIITKAVIETNQQFETMKKIENYNISSNSSSIENICRDTADKCEDMSEDTYLDNCLAYNENNIDKEDTYSDNDISDISNDSSTSSRISLFTSVSPLTLSESSYAFDEYSESSPEVNEMEPITNKNEEQQIINSTELEILSGEKLSNEKNILCESKPNDNDYDGHEDDGDVIEGDRYSEHKSEISAGISEREFSDLLEPHNTSNSCSTQSSISRGPSKLQIRKKGLNLTFSRDEMIKIERDNLILLKKIMAHSKPASISLNKPFTHKKTSSAINRAKQQKKIEQDNYILHSKISAIGRMKKVF